MDLGPPPRTPLASASAGLDLLLRHDGGDHDSLDFDFGATSRREQYKENLRDADEESYFGSEAVGVLGGGGGGGEEQRLIQREIPVQGYRVLSQIGSGTYGKVYKVCDKADDAKRKGKKTVGRNMAKKKGKEGTGSSASTGACEDDDGAEERGQGQGQGQDQDQDQEQEQEVFVLKQVPLDGLTERERAETINEAQLMISIEDHAHIVRHVDSFIEADCLNMVMQFCGGGDLSVRIRRLREAGGAFEERFVWKVLGQVAAALQHLHAHRILHRDIKPENIFLDDDDQVKVGDLGLGRLLSSQSRFAHSTVGTPLYFSPELCEEALYDEQSDIWALGCLTYQMAALRPPFLASNQIALARKIVGEEPRPIPQRYCHNLAFIIGKMLLKDPQQRPNAGQILQYAPVYVAQEEERLRVRAEAAFRGFARKEEALSARVRTLEAEKAACAEELRAAREGHALEVARLKAGEHKASRQAQVLAARLRDFEIRAAADASRQREPREPREPRESRESREHRPGRQRDAVSGEAKSAGKLKARGNVKQQKQKQTQKQTQHHKPTPRSLSTRPGAKVAPRAAGGQGRGRGQGDGSPSGTGALAFAGTFAGASADEEEDEKVVEGEEGEGDEGDEGYGDAEKSDAAVDGGALLHTPGPRRPSSARKVGISIDADKKKKNNKNKLKVKVKKNKKPQRMSPRGTGAHTPRMKATPRVKTHDPKSRRQPSSSSSSMPPSPSYSPLREMDRNVAPLSAPRSQLGPARRVPASLNHEGDIDFDFGVVLDELA